MLSDEYQPKKLGVSHASPNGTPAQTRMIRIFLTSSTKKDPRANA